MNTLIRMSMTFLCLSMIGPDAWAVSPPPDGGYGGGNTAEGENALFRLTTGLRNTGIGNEALFGNTTGNLNTATGFQALHDNTEGRLNTATGYQALFNNTTGEFNTATGSRALIINSTGVDNTANGYAALGNNTNGTRNTATGVEALFNNTTGDNNTATGEDALSGNTTGINNTANGVKALESNTSGNRNTANGVNALQSNTTGDANVALGYRAGGNATTGDGNVYIGSGMDGVAGEARHTYIRNINGTPVSGGGTTKVTVDLDTGLIGHETSSRRYKQDIKPMDNASHALFALKPVTYHYKKEIDPRQLAAFGLIAEEVAEVNPNLVTRNSQGQPESVHYEMVNSMLLNEFLKEHQTVQELKRQVAALTAGLQRVSAQLQLNKPAPQTVLNNQ